MNVAPGAPSGTPRKGRNTALACSVLLLGVLAASASVFKDLALEEWSIYKLDSPDREARRAAAARLGELGSVKAMGRLLEELRAPGGPIAGGSMPTVTLWAASFSSDGKLIASGGASGTARLWDAASGEELQIGLGGGFDVGALRHHTLLSFSRRRALPS